MGGSAGRSGGKQEGLISYETQRLGEIITIIILRYVDQGGLELTEFRLCFQSAGIEGGLRQSERAGYLAIPGSLFRAGWPQTLPLPAEC